MKVLIALALVATAATAAAEPTADVSASLGVGSSHPYRPGDRGPARLLDISGRYRSFQLSFQTRSEGDRVLQGEGTMLHASFGLTYHLPLARSDRYARAGGHVFVLLDLVPSAGLGVEGAYGIKRNEFGGDFELGGYVGWHTDWYSSWGDGDPELAGLATGAEFSARRSFVFARVRAGLVALRQPDASIHIGASWSW